MPASIIAPILVLYIINATLSGILFKKNDRPPVDTLITIAIFGLAVNGIIFFVAAFLQTFLIV